MKTILFFRFSPIFLILGILLACQEQATETQKSNIHPKQSPLPNPTRPQIPLIEKQMMEQGLLNIRELDSSILVELKYSTNDNFVGTDVYGDLTNAYLQRMPAEKLIKANQLLKDKYPNYRLLVYDAARPLRIQKIFWDLLDSIPPTRRKDYVSDPSEVSIHNLGSAVDLTIFDLERNQVLDMGTKYDYFGELAYPKYE